MAKTLRFRTREGWTTKPLERTEANRLIAEEIDDNFLALEDQTNSLETLSARQHIPAVSRSDVADYALALADAGKWVRVNRSTATTVTVPSNASVAFEVGTRIWVRRVGTGTLTLVAAGGVTLNFAGSLAIGTKHGTALLVKVNADEWDVSKDLGG